MAAASAPLLSSNAPPSKDEEANLHAASQQSHQPLYPQPPAYHQVPGAYPQGQGQPYPPGSAYPPQQYPPQQPGAVGYYPNPNQGAPAGYAPIPQQQTAVVVGPPAPIIVVQAPSASYCGMIVLACVVYWFCNWLFGIIAFILAVVAENTKISDPNGARKLGKASMWVSISGIIVTVVIIAIVVGVVVCSGSYYSRYNYYYYG